MPSSCARSSRSATTWGSRCVAEGVETEEQLEFLRANGCDELQGYYLSTPVSAWQMGKLLAKLR